MTAIVIVYLWAPVAGMAQEGVVTLETLLDEMVDRDGMARFPAPEYRLRQQSSYDRGSKTPARRTKGLVCQPGSGAFHPDRDERRAERMGPDGA
jgi:hypothetical protein